MPSDPSFVAHAVDLLSLLGPVTARAMFGGHGLYAGDVMFGLLDDGELFLKTDPQTREQFIAAGCRQWVYVNKKARMEHTGFFRPPDDAHEDPEAMLPWARLALEAARRARAEKAAKAAAKAKRGKPATRTAPRKPAATAKAARRKPARPGARKAAPPKRATRKRRTR
jgi:DNA transformation protein